MTFRYLSVCSGIEAASVAFEPFGAIPVGFSEIEAFPSAVLAERYGSNMPGQPLSHNLPPNFGDFTTIDVGMLGQVDVLVGGTPCQAFSVAGKRLSLADVRGNLTLAYAVLAHELARSNGLRNCIWENVPGVLSAQDNAFGCFLGQLVGADDALHTPDGGSWPDFGMVAGPRARAAWRICDAQWWGLAQRRRRVFVVADFGNGADPAAVLFEPKSLRGNYPPSREKRKRPAPPISARTQGGRGIGTDFECDGGLIAADVAPTLNAHFGDKQGLEDQHINGGGACSLPSIALCLNAGGMGRLDAESETLIPENGGVFDVEQEIAGTLGAGDGSRGWRNDLDQGAFIPVSIFQDSEFGVQEYDTAGSLRAGRIPEHQMVIQPTAYRTSPNCGAWETGERIDALTTGTDPTSHVLAFAQNERDEVRLVGGDGSVVGDLSSQPGMKQQSYVSFQTRGSNLNIGDISGTIGTNSDRASGSAPMVSQNWAVRRLTPEECEKLQGFPVGYTRIHWRGKSPSHCPDGPRYKALGNSFAVPVVGWIGKRLMEALP